VIGGPVDIFLFFLFFVRYYRVGSFCVFLSVGDFYGSVCVFVLVDG